MINPSATYTAVNGSGAGASVILQNGKVVGGRGDVTFPVGPSANPSGLANVGAEIGPNTIAPSASYRTSNGSGGGAGVTLQDGKPVSGRGDVTFPVGPSAKRAGTATVGVEVRPNSIAPSASFTAPNGSGFTGAATIEDGKVVGGTGGVVISIP